MTSRIPILAPRGRDAPVIAQILMQMEASTAICADGPQLLVEIDRGADAAVLTEEALAAADLTAIAGWLALQPSWADFPFVVLARPHGLPSATTLTTLIEALGNVVVLERPIHASTLTSAVRSALRARGRQYQARRHWIERENDERRLRVALLAGNLGAWTVDLLDRSLTLSDRLRAHFGRAPDEPLSGLDIVAAVHPDDRQAFSRAVRRTLTGHDDLAVEVRILRPDSEIRWLQFSGRTIFGDDGRPMAVSGVSRDITDRHTSELELQRRVADAVDQNQRAQLALVQAQKMEAVGQLTGGIAHDFNNLLTAIVGNVDLIARRAEDPRLKTMAARARQAAERAAKLTTQLLAFSRSQKLDLKPVEVDRLIRNMRDLLARTIGATISVTVELNAGDRAAIADENQLELAVLNLAINARDAMPSGGSLLIRTRRDRPASGEDTQGWIAIQVTDSGAGIPPDILPRVFDPFFTTKPVGKGTGLGLSQVHGIANQSGGSVNLTSTVGQGTTVEIRLREADGEAAARQQTDPEDALYLGHGRVLVIDDDADVRRFAVECLELLGFSTAQADSGRAGLEQLDREPPDLVIVDFAMPGMNGAQVAAAARARYPRLPLILATGYADTGQVEAAFAQDQILRKPFRIHDLSRAVRHALEPR